MSENEVTNYKVSFVVIGAEHPGAIINVESEPHPGDEVQFDGRVFKITEIMELMPPIGNFAFLHATCEFLREEE